MEFPTCYEEDMEQVESEEKLSACCNAEVVQCKSCGDDTPEHTECTRCHTLVAQIGEDRLLSRAEMLADRGATVERVDYSPSTEGSAVKCPCPLCGGRGTHPGVVGHYDCRRCNGTGMSVGR